MDSGGTEVGFIVVNRRTMEEYKKMTTNKRGS